VVGSGQLVWVATALLGIGLAPQFATMIAFAERHVAITGSATSWFIGAVAIGGFVLPWLIGQLFDRTGSEALPAAVLISAGATLAWLVVVARMFGRRSGLAAGPAAAAGASVGVVPGPSLLPQEGLELGG
jgi:fucose permease